MSNTTLEITCPTCRQGPGAGCIPLGEEMVVATHLSRRIIDAASPRGLVAVEIRRHVLSLDGVRCSCGMVVGRAREHAAHVALALECAGYLR